MIVEKERRMNMQVEFSQLTEFLPFLIPLILNYSRNSFFPKN